MKNPFGFISYRRDDEGPTSIFIKAKLDEVFGSEHDFMDPPVGEYLESSDHSSVFMGHRT